MVVCAQAFGQLSDRLILERVGPSDISTSETPKSADQSTNESAAVSALVDIDG